MPRIKSTLVGFLASLVVASTNLEQTYGMEIEKLSQAIVKITSGKTVGSGVVIETRKKSNEAIILTAYSNIEDPDSIVIEFASISKKRRTAMFLHKDPDRDVALLKIGNPPQKIPNIDFGDAAGLEEGDSVFYFEYVPTLGLVKHDAHICNLEAAYIAFSTSLDKSVCGGPVFDFHGENVVGMVQKSIERQRRCDQALKSGAIAATLRSWGINIELRKLPMEEKIPPEAQRVVAVSLSPRFALIRGKLLPFSEDWRWELNEAATLRLTIEVAKKDEIGHHRFGIICSRFSSKPTGANPMGRLSSTLVVPIYSNLTTIAETRGKRFGAEFTVGIFGLGRHTLENGYFAEDTLSEAFIPQGGVRDIYFALFTESVVEVALSCYLTNHFAILLGCEAYRFDIRGHSNYYYSFFVGANLRLNP